MRGEFAASMSDIGLPLSSEQAKDRVVKDGEHLRRMTHTQLRMIFAHRGNTTDNAVSFRSPNVLCSSPVIVAPGLEVG